MKYKDTISFYVSHNCQRWKCHKKFSPTSEEFGLASLNHNSNTGNSFFENLEIYVKMSVACFILLLTLRQICLGKKITIKQNTTQNSH